METSRLPSRKKLRKHLQHTVPNIRRVVKQSPTGMVYVHLRETSYPHETPVALRAFPEQQDYKPKYVRPLHARIGFHRSAAHGKNRNMNLIYALRTAAAIKASGVNYRPIVSKKKARLAQE